MKNKVFIEANRIGYDPSQIECTMTVWELAHYLLDNFEEDAEVYISNDEGYTFGSISARDICSELY